MEKSARRMRTSTESEEGPSHVRFVMSRRWKWGHSNLTLLHGATERVHGEGELKGGQPSENGRQGPLTGDPGER